MNDDVSKTLSKALDRIDYRSDNFYNCSSCKSNLLDFLILHDLTSQLKWFERENRTIEREANILYFMFGLSFATMFATIGILLLFGMGCFHS